MRSVSVSMTEFSVHLSSDSCLAEFLTNSPSDSKISIPGWSSLVGQGEVVVTDCYYPSHVMVQNVKYTLYVYSPTVKPTVAGKYLSQYSTQFFILT